MQLINAQREIDKIKCLHLKNRKYQTRFLRFHLKKLEKKEQNIHNESTRKEITKISLKKAIKLKTEKWYKISTKSNVGL